MLADDQFPACHSNLWDHVNGWEVVAAVLFIMSAWSATNIARMYFMVQIAERNGSAKTKKRPSRSKRTTLPGRDDTGPTGGGPPRV